jgi:large subunit ribosomal protein L1
MLTKENVLRAISEVKAKSEKRNFVQSIELIINLRDVDLKKTENRFQERLELPFLEEKKRKVCVIASGEMALKARRFGADLIIQRSELEALSGNKKKQRELARTYDFFISEAPLMPSVGRIMGAILGPRGKMPTPVSPSIDITEQIEKHRKMVLIRLRGQPIIQCQIGNENMSNDKIAENVQAILRGVEGKLKRGFKNVESIYLKSTMGSPVRIEIK